MVTHKKQESIAECFARNLRNLRKERGLTQDRLAQACGISLVFLQNLEAGRRWVSPQTVASLAKAMKVRENDFFQSESGTEKRTSSLPLEWQHIPKDVQDALVNVCKHPSWPWDAFRILVLGFESSRSPYKKAPSGFAHPTKSVRTFQSRKN